MSSFVLPEDGSELLRMERREFNHGALQRTYTLYSPPSLEESKTAAPLLLLFHGGGGLGKRMVNFTGFDLVAAREGFFVLAPDGIERHWNDGRIGLKDRAFLENIDDVGFVTDLLGYIKGCLNIDSRRVYAAGISNGAMMAMRLGLELSDRIAALASVAASLPEPLAPVDCSGLRTPPALLINGTADPVVPYEGGELLYYGKSRGRVLSVPDTAALFAACSNCHSVPEISVLTAAGAKSGMAVKKIRYSGCRDDAEILSYVVEGGGHSWPRDSRLAQYLPERVIGKACRDFESSEIIWQFFQKYSLKS